jgi:peptidoglycan/xylan/chitin deacetylase (PgdA/CDA1 family)
MYLPTAFIESASAFKGHRCMTWGQVRELHRSGIQFGSHTVNHPKLWNCSWTVIKSELTNSKHTIEDHLGVEASAFAYPFAFPQQDCDFVTRFEGELKSAGYTSCVTTTIGRMRAGDNRFRIQRLPLNNCDDRQLLTAKLVGSYDWLRWPQSARKKLSRAPKRH